MATATLMSVSEYLATNYRPDCDYIDGEVKERLMGETAHAAVQTALAIFFKLNLASWQVRAIVERRVQVSPTRFRIPDVCGIRVGDGPQGPILRTPPLICIEVLSPEDSLSDMQDRIADYQAFGVGHIWLIDPVRRYAWRAMPDSLVREHEAFTVDGTPIRITLAELYAELDEILAGR